MRELSKSYFQRASLLGPGFASIVGWGLGDTHINGEI